MVWKLLWERGGGESALGGEKRPCFLTRPILKPPLLEDKVVECGTQLRGEQTSFQVEPLHRPEPVLPRACVRQRRRGGALLCFGVSAGTRANASRGCAGPCLRHLLHSRPGSGPERC